MKLENRWDQIASKTKVEKPEVKSHREEKKCRGKTILVIVQAEY